MAILQVALDFINLERALEVGELALKGGVNFIEIGTPLIKSEGMNAIRKFREKFPDVTLVADMKTMDVGDTEIEIAAKAGANMICVLGVASKETIERSAESAKKYNVKLIIDMMNVHNKISVIKQLENIDVISYICLHTGIDDQMRFLTPFDELNEIKKITKIPIGVAGGLNSENVAYYIKQGTELIIVGSAITKSENVISATKSIKTAIDKCISIKSEVKRVGKEELEKIFYKVSTPNLSDAMHRKNAMKDIRPICDGVKLVGSALTVKTLDGDWAKPVQAIDLASENTAIVIDVGGNKTAVWGELATWSCKQKKIRGVVIDGAVRDIQEIKKLNFPVFAKHISPDAGEPKGFGEIGIDIVCGGVVVRKDDWIIGDDNGVVVVPKEKALQIANRALDLYHYENRLRCEIKEGKTLSIITELDKWEVKKFIIKKDNNI